MKHYTVKDLSLLEPGFYWVKTRRTDLEPTPVKVVPYIYDNAYTGMSLPYPRGGTKHNSIWEDEYPDMRLWGPFHQPSEEELQ